MILNILYIWYYRSTFYKEPIGVLDSVCVVNETHDGKLVVHAKAKLPEEPDRIEFDIHYADIVDWWNICNLNYHTQSKWL